MQHLLLSTGCSISPILLLDADIDAPVVATSWLEIIQLLLAFYSSGPCPPERQKSLAYRKHTNTRAHICKRGLYDISVRRNNICLTGSRILAASPIRTTTGTTDGVKIAKPCHRQLLAPPTERFGQCCGACTHFFKMLRVLPKRRRYLFKQVKDREQKCESKALTVSHCFP